MLTVRSRAAAGLQTDRSAVAAVEFAIIAPVLVMLLGGVVDVTRALIAWQQTNEAARTIALAAEKLSVTSGQTTNSLTATQIQAAMSSIYSVIPALKTGANTSQFLVSLSSIVYEPRCATSINCGAQVPYVLWSSYLNEGPSNLVKPILRPCGVVASAATFPDTGNNWITMVVPTSSLGTTLSPQVVADVAYGFTPWFNLFVGARTFYASSLMPAPLGDTSQEITFNSSAGSTAVYACPALP
jgi:hypothetical protein